MQSLLNPQSGRGFTNSGGGYSLAGGFWGSASSSNKVYLPVVRR